MPSRSRPPIPYRLSNWDWAKSTYAIEVNPWVQRDEIEAVFMYRGVIISAYANIETKLAEIAIRASRLAEYAAIRDRFPYSMDKRRNFLRAVFRTGPLTPYSGLAERFLDRFEATAELRHRMAHASMETAGDLIGWGAVFHEYQPSGVGLEYRRRRMPLAELEQEAWRASRLSRLGQRLSVLLDQTGVLPEISPP